MPTKKNRTHRDHPVPTLADAGIGGGQRKHGEPAPQHLFENIRGSTSKGAFGTIRGEHDVKTRVSFGGGKREKPKMTK
jgi:hypothetical protein